MHSGNKKKYIFSRFQLFKQAYVCMWTCAPGVGSASKSLDAVNPSN